jgi:hypothetical protein
MYDARWKWEAPLKADCVRLFCGTRSVVVVLLFRKDALVGGVFCKVVVVLLFMCLVQEERSEACNECSGLLFYLLRLMQWSINFWLGRQLVVPHGK